MFALIPVLVANGESDKMVPSSNSVDLSQRPPNAELVLYQTPDTAAYFSITKRLLKKRSSFSDHKTNYESLHYRAL